MVFRCSTEMLLFGVSPMFEETQIFRSGSRVRAWVVEDAFVQEVPARINPCRIRRAGRAPSMGFYEALGLGVPWWSPCASEECCENSSVKISWTRLPPGIGEWGREGPRGRRFQPASG